MTKNGFDNKLASFNIKITSNKRKCLEVQKKVNSLTTKDYNFFYAQFILQVMLNLKTRLFINQHQIR